MDSFGSKTTIIPVSLKPFTKTGSQGGAVFTTVKTAVPPSLRKTHKLSSSLLPRKATKDNNLPTKVLNLADEFIDAFIDPPGLRSSVDPRHVLSSNFAPVDELPPTECEVAEGSLPSCLDGVYIRNGPNPQHPPRGPYHLFDGDGMLHAVRISGGKATFCSRYVRTYKFEVEREIGRPVFPSVFSGFNGLAAIAARGALAAARTLSGQYDPANGIGLANTSLANFGGKLYALGESDLPYAVKMAPDGDIITLGRHDFGGKLKTNMTAHPKIDPATGEAFAFRYGPVPPYLSFFKVNADGTKERDVPIYSVARPSFMHDFAITENYAIFTDTQIEMAANPLDLLLKTGDTPVRAVPEKVPRIGVIRRDAKEGSGMRWVDAPGFNNVHAINAWEEDGGETIVMVAPNILGVEHALERVDMIHASMERVKIDLKTGMVSRHPLSTRNLDFGVINPAYVTKKNKFVYAGVEDPMPKISGVVKLDISVTETDRQDCIVASRLYGAGCFGGEPFFVGKDNGGVDEEDDGYILSYVHDEKRGESRFVVMDARTPHLDIVAAVKLPRRVPYGFHGIFVPEAHLLNMP
ncbi:unnamed protein product [Cuscuta campestris]|uniref:9-cis-epoxycarotenoid dioxygenase n=1 Tax=Cuscuta campestris TaxID=132261 RepID=A0A484NKW0_9ASTE|nr:unnamed protein product [Cuscuta campestris]